MFWFIALFVVLGYRLVSGKKCGEDEFQVSARRFKNTNLQYTVSSQDSAAVEGGYTFVSVCQMFNWIISRWIEIILSSVLTFSTVWTTKNHSPLL